MPEPGTARIRPAIVYAWHGPALLIADNRGECGSGDTLTGFYVREARHLSTLRLLVDGERPWPCEVAAPTPAELALTLIHPEVTELGGGGSGEAWDGVTRDRHGLPHRGLDLRLWCRVGLAGLDVELTIANRSGEEVACEVAWELAADFADLQEAHAGKRQVDVPVRTEIAEGALRFRSGHPGLPLETVITAAPEAAAWRIEEGRLAVPLRLAPQQCERLVLRIAPRDPEHPLAPEEAARREEAWQRWRAGLARVEMPRSQVLERVVERNVEDFASFPLLDGADDEWLTLQAGVPLYPGLFGRDTLTAGWQAACLDRGESLQDSLNRLGRRQTDRFDDRHDEEPGRIPFQMRGGPLARLGVNPFGASYADFASPFMFVVGLAHAFAWSGREELLERHWDRARRVLDWAREHGDRDGDGYLEYLTRSPEGTKNQGWKDSGNAILDEEGNPVPAPLGTSELQGYWFAAQQMMAILAGFRGEQDDARAWWHAAQDLKRRFNRDWWLDGPKFPALALGPDKRPVATIASNAGHCLAAGILTDEHVPPVVGRLLAPDLWSGWGVRTLSSEHPSYNPLSYHLGSVWAVENATIALGLRRYGFDVQAARLADGLFSLAQRYPGDRIPECVGGYGRFTDPSPGAYPRANTPQAWNASAFPLLVHTLLGLQPVAPLDLLVVDPALPAWLPEVIVHGLRIAGATVTLRCWRDEAGRSHAEIVRKRGTLRLLRQPPPESLRAGVADRLRALLDGALPHWGGRPG